MHFAAVKAIPECAYRSTTSVDRLPVTSVNAVAYMLQIVDADGGPIAHLYGSVFLLKLRNLKLTTSKDATWCMTQAVWHVLIAAISHGAS